jgi:hypothetical protein
LKKHIPVRNIVLSNFLTGRRRQLELSQVDMGQALGQTCGARWCYLETVGRLPKNKQQREIIARMLQVTVEELLEKEQSRPEDEVDILALLKAIVASAPNEITLSDIKFLLCREASLKRSLSQHEIRRIMNGRRTSTHGATLSVVQRALAA